MGSGKRTPRLLFPRAHLGIIKEPPGREQLGRQACGTPNAGASPAEGRVILRGGELFQGVPRGRARVPGCGQPCVPGGTGTGPGASAGSLQPLPPDSTPLLPLSGRGGAQALAAAPRASPPAFVAVRIPMLLFLTGHWWLYRQVLRRGCNCPAWSLPTSHPTLAARVLLLPPGGRLPGPAPPGRQSSLERACPSAASEPRMPTRCPLASARPA